MKEQIEQIEALIQNQQMIIVDAERQIANLAAMKKVIENKIDTTRRFFD